MAAMVVGFVFSGTKVLLVKKARPEWQAGLFNGIGGKCEPGERPRDAMAREFKEETGLDLRRGIWAPMLRLDTTDGSVVHFFTATITHEAVAWLLTPQPDEPVSWVDVCELDATDVVPNLRWLVPMAYTTQLKDRNTWPFLVIERQAW